MENTESPPSAKGSTLWKEAIVAIGLPAVLVAAFVVYGGFRHGLPMVEKMLKGFVLPCGIVWLLMLIITAWSFQRGQRIIGALGAILFALHGLIGGEIFSVWLSQRLEAPYAFVNPQEAEHFDVIVILGGGAKSGSLDHAGFSFAGDRVGLAVRLYHAGKADRLVFTGSNMPWETQKLSPSAAARRLAIELKVPEPAIMLTEGHNTYQEFQSLRTEYQDLPDARIGLVTSATHMPRAMRLANSVGLSMVPIPADFERRAEPPTLLSVIPSAAGYRMTERCCVEFLAWFVGR